MRRWIYIALALSLALNLLLVGGFLYQRYVVQPRLQSAWAEQALHLDAGRTEELRRLQQWSNSRIRDMLAELAPEIADARRGLREGVADDPALRTTMRRLSDRRLDLQMEALARMIAFRDRLDPEQRQAFNRLAGQPGFVLNLLGLGRGARADASNRTTARHGP